MVKQFIFILLLSFPLSLMAQNDDPFGGGSSGGDDPFGGGSSSDPFGGGSSDDPFGGSTPTNDPATESIPQTTPSTQPTTEPSTTSDDPFSSSPSESTDSSDPFSSSSSTSDSGSDMGMNSGGMSGGGDAFDNMVDTLSEPLVPEFPWEQRAIKEKPILNYYDTDETDVFWAKTVYREIDIREKMNHTFAYPRAPFMTILLDILQKNPDMKVYKEDVFSGRDFSEEDSWAKIEERLGNKREEKIYNEDGTYDTQEIVDKFRSSKVKRYKVKEVWFFDKKESRMKVRIMGIAPLMEVSAADFDADAVLAMQMGMQGATAQKTLFWVYYPDIRDELARYQTFNPLNDAMRMSWDDLLSARYFSSYITKASNPLDRAIADYTRNGLEALWESERIKEEIFNFEQDLWTY